MNDPRKTAISLLYNGKNISTKITDYLEGFTYTDVASGETDTLAITLSEHKHKWIKDWFPTEGDYLEATIYVNNWTKQNDNRKLKCGKFLIDDYGFSGPNDIYNLNAISSPINTEFTSTEKSKAWKDTTIKGIASTIAKSAGLTLHYDAESYKIKKIEQSSQSDMSFLFNICKDYNLAMKLYNSKLVIFDEIKYEQKKEVGTINKSQCSSWDLNGTLVGIYHGVIIKYTKPKTNKTLTYKYMIKEGKRILKVNEKAESYVDAEIKAKAKLRQKNKAAMTINLTLMGDVKYLAGTCYKLTGFGKFNGKYYIDKVTHTLNGGYVVTLQMHKVLNITINKKSTSDKESSLVAGTSYSIVTKLTGYYTALEAKNLKATNKTGLIYPGKYYVYNKASGMVNVTKVKGVAGVWINPNKNVS